ncbi:GTPase [Dyella sp. 333MFSha]|uniref:GTPase n=1 Tax=Dyella sp. 333MFSha TaxID=1798240 RepID=UPI00088600E3|nr:GTPase [Dyella sp. 333MFSha]SDF96796.1 50S ribosome-binding GTPase [Dyella sp. 333MFSha]
MTPFVACEQLLSDAAPLASRYVPGIDATLSTLEQQVRDDRVKVMLYGAYNAGKSTLINTLLAEEAATVGDIPTTDNVHAYDWEGNVLLDTPGVNAPIEHEEVSLARLKETDLVLFVLRQEDQDADDVLRRIFELLDAGHPVFIVLNVPDSDPDYVEHTRERLGATLLTYAAARTPAYGVEALAQIPVAILNARSALRARLDGKALLQERAGFDQFIEQFNAWLKRHEGVQERLASLKANVTRALMQPVKAAIDHVELPDAETDDAVQARADLVRATRYLRQTAMSKTRHEINLRRAALSKALALGDSQAAIAQVTVVSGEVIQSVEKWLQDEAEHGVLAGLSARLGVGEIDIGESAQVDDSKLGRAGRDAAINTAKSGANAENITKLLLLARKLKLFGLKGRHEKTLEKLAGKAAPWLQLGLAAAEAGVAHYDEANENKVLLGQALAHEQRVTSICTQIQTDIVEGIDSQLKDYFNQLVEPVDARLDALREGESSLNTDRLAWAALTARVQDLAI